MIQDHSDHGASVRGADISLSSVFPSFSWGKSGDSSDL